MFTNNIIKFVLSLVLMVPALSYGANWSPIENEVSISGHIYAIKKLRSVDACKNYADKHQNAIAFTVNAKAGKCITFKNIRHSVSDKKGYTSQRKIID